MSRSAESDSFWNMRAFKGYLPLNVEEVRANSARSSSENAGRGGGVKSSSPPGALSWKGSCILSGALASLLTMYETPKVPQPTYLPINPPGRLFS